MCTERIGFVGCVGQKKSQAAAAADLYTSTLFRGRRRWVERTCHRWFILSALHGLVEPPTQLEPYDLSLTDVGTHERRRWAARVLRQVDEALGEVAGIVFEIHAGAAYREHGLVQGLEQRGALIEVPMAGLRIGGQLAAYASQTVSADPERLLAQAPSLPVSEVASQHPPGGPAEPGTFDRDSAHVNELDRFYELLDLLRSRTGTRRLADSHGRMGWPQRGVYFFFEAGEHRADGNPRVVRVGTHALRPRSRTTLWGRLSQHRGAVEGSNPGGGDHRGSVFRLHVGVSLLRRDGDPDGVLRTWGQGTSASPEVRMSEGCHERRVSEYIEEMPLLWLAVDDPPGPASDRGVTESGAIGLLSRKANPIADPPSTDWLGLQSDRSAIVGSGLWNVNHVEGLQPSAWLDVMERHIGAVP